MSLAVGFGCLMAVAVLDVVIGGPGLQSSRIGAGGGIGGSGVVYLPDGRVVGGPGTSSGSGGGYGGSVYGYEAGNRNIYGSVGGISGASTGTVFAASAQNNRNIYGSVGGISGASTTSVSQVGGGVTNNDTEFTMLPESEEFVLQHIESGLWVQTLSTANKQKLILGEILNDMCKFKVKRRADTLLAHVKHVASGKYWHPLGDKPVPGLRNKIVIQDNFPYTTLFIFNQANNVIKHQSGKYIAPLVRYNAPGTDIILFEDSASTKIKEVNAHFKAFSYSNPSQEILIYGNADVTAFWRLVFSLDTPAITIQTFEEVIHVGYSKSESSEKTKTFAWEISAKKQFWFAEMSISLNIKSEVKKSSAETWSESVQQNIKITVPAGKTVALWQRFFKGSQMTQISVQQSNQYAQTKNSLIRPDDDGASSTSYYIYIGDNNDLYINR